MLKEIKCPECGSYNIEERLTHVGIAPAAPDEDLPKIEKQIVYECVDCGLIFFESNLRE